MTCRYKKTRNIVYIIMGTICVWGILYAIFVINLSHRYNSWASAAPSVPIVVTTWPFVNATNKAWESVYFQKYSAVESIELGCRVCEREQCDFTVGYGGSPDESGETTVEALIMDGKTMNVGAVANLRRVKNAISVARHVLEYTSHSLLSGDQATEFAKKMGFKEESLSTNYSRSMWKKWTEKKCQPNFWMNVKPDSKSQCGPYKPIKVRKPVQNYNEDMFNEKNHDTIGMVVIDSKNNIAAGTSTNGAKYKIPGRIGDSPIPGAGAYADNSVGGAAATGDGDVMLRFLPSFLAVEEMRKGASPTEAANTAINRIASKYSSFFGGVIAVDMMGNHGAACHGMEKFHYSICNAKLGQVTVKSVPCLNIEL